MSGAGQGPPLAVDVVAHHRVADGRQVDPDLVGPAGLQRGRHQGGGGRRGEPLLDPVAGAGLLAPAGHRHPGG